jgi:DNA polymerase-3 subunit alpha
MSKFKQCVNPHSHSHYSLDGASTVKQIVDRNYELGAKYVSMTEHGNMNSGIDLYHTCKSYKKGKISPILGIELYMQAPFQDEIRKEFESYYRSINNWDEKQADKIEKKIREAYVHLTVHFKDEFAYQYFCKLTPKMEERAIVKFGERKPVCTLEELYGAAGHITICSSCLVGTVARFLNWEIDRKENKSFKRPDLAIKAYHTIREIAGKDDFFVEIFPHEVTHNWKAGEKDGSTQGCFEPIPNGDLQLEPNNFIRQLAKENGDRLIISLDSHFALPSQKFIQDAKLGNGREAWKFHASYHIMSTDECAPYFQKVMGATDRDIEEWVDNSYLWASRFDHFNLTMAKDRWILPEMTEDWMTWLKSRLDYHGRMNWNDPIMVTQLQKELKVFTNNGTINLISYFTVPEMVARFCRENGILMFARGSAPGSLLLYLLGVSGINPLKHDLNFERFITEGRIKSGSLPDVDMDFSDRDRVLDMLKNEFGDRFLQLSIDTKLKIKSSVKDAARFMYGEVSADIDNYCSKLPTPPQGVDEHDFVFGYEDSDGNHIDGLIEVDPNLKELAAKYPDLWEHAQSMMGIIRQKSQHACGCIIGNVPIQEIAPTFTLNSTRLCGLSPKFAEMVGLVKYDFLSVTMLTTLEKARSNIQKQKGILVDLDNLPDEAEVYRRLGNGDTVGVFQLDTPTVRPGLAKIKPTNRDGIANLTALYRPGTMDAKADDGRTLVEIYIACSQGEPIRYVHQDLEPILKDTFGLALFQEQTLRIFRDIAGMTYEEAEVVRRAIGKKDKKTLESCTQLLKEKCLLRGWTEAQATLLMQQIMASANYSFNKSHAVSYAYIAYACAYLKTFFPIEFWAALLSTSDKGEIVGEYWSFVKDFTSPPDLNLSDAKDFSITPGNRLVAPLGLLSGIGEKGYAQLTNNRPYADMRDYITKNHTKVKGSRSAIDRGLTYSLIAAGVLDSLFGKDQAGEELNTPDKIFHFNQLYAEVREEKSTDPVPEAYIGMTTLGAYLAKKEIMPIYSEDLRPIMLPARGGKPDPQSTAWVLANGIKCIDGRSFKYFEEAAIAGRLPEGFKCTFIAYIIDEKVKPYAKKTKKMTELSMDIGGCFTQTVLWPAYEESVAQTGFKKRPCVLYYEVYFSKKKQEWVFALKGVSPLIPKEQLGIYNIV